MKSEFCAHKIYLVDISPMYFKIRTMLNKMNQARTWGVALPHSPPLILVNVNDLTPWMNCIKRIKKGATLIPGIRYERE